MADAFHDQSGRVIGWLVPTGRIVNLQGRSSYWLQGKNVYDYRGAHRGWFENGHWRGSDGGVMAFTANASGTGVVLPVRSVSPVMPVLAVEPVRPVASVAPVRPVNRISWSGDRFA